MASINCDDGQQIPQEVTVAILINHVTHDETY